VTTKALIIPAAGSGSRMKKETPKPYLSLAGRTILEHTIRRFLQLDGLVQIIVATSEEFLERSREIIAKTLPPTISGECLIGGDERQDSIYNALSNVSEVELVIVHDAVRPFVREEDIQKCCQVAADVGASVLGVPAKDTIKRIDDEQFVRETPDRKYLWKTQTPQVFRKNVILKAYEKAFRDSYSGTDDASLVERLEQQVKMVRGRHDNFKITYPLDLKLAKLLIEKDRNE
jgi:2-C-methyl-D-erythritol 4-phosphate cytidylyltransferase